MKKTIILIALGIFSLPSCTKNKVEKNSSAIPASSSDKQMNSWTSFTQSEILEVIKDLGYVPNQVREVDDYFIVDRDILFSKLKQNTMPEKLNHATALVGFIQQQNIRVKIDASIPPLGSSNWRTAIANAFTSWNNISNCRLNFVIVTSGDFDVLVKTDDGILKDDNTTCLGCGIYAQAAAGSFPLSGAGKPGNEILINVDIDSYYYNGPLTLAQKVFNVTHVIGHVVGFQNQNVTGGGISWLVPGTTNSDPNSIMQDLDVNNTLTFSSGDILGIQYLYGTGIRVAFKSSNGKYLSAVNNGGGLVNCQGNYAGQWETFHLVPSPLYGAPYYVLRTVTGKYMQATNGGGGTLNANSNNPWGWETFELVPSALYPGKFNLKLRGTNFYVQANSGGGGTVNVASTNPWAWESYDVIYSYY